VLSKQAPALDRSCSVAVPMEPIPDSTFRPSNACERIRLKNAGPWKCAAPRRGRGAQTSRFKGGGFIDRAQIPDKQVDDGHDEHARKNQEVLRQTREKEIYHPVSVYPVHITDLLNIDDSIHVYISMHFGGRKVSPLPRAGEGAGVFRAMSFRTPPRMGPTPIPTFVGVSYPSFVAGRSSFDAPDPSPSRASIFLLKRGPGPCRALFWILGRDKGCIKMGRKIRPFHPSSSWPENQ